MYKINLRSAFLTGMMVISLSAMSQPPYMIEKVISENKLAKFNNQKLLVIDFWATWCATCPSATEQLEILQRAKANEVFIVSVSDETVETISTYLQRIPIRLTVLKDYLPNSLVDLFKIKRRPYAVLLNLDGEILYIGHPSGITPNMIDHYASQMKSKPKKKWSDMFIAVQNPASQINFPPQNQELFITKQPLAEKKMYIENGIFYYSGLLSGLISYLMDCSNYQIIFNNANDYGVLMSCNEAELLDSKPAILKFIENRLSLNIQTEIRLMEAHVLEVVKPGLLWDNKQINWGGDTNHTYLVGTDRVEADNISLTEVANLLSDIKGKFYYYKGDDVNLYDWSFHYRFDDLMIDDLESNFGIVLKKETMPLPVYILSSK